MKKITIYLFSIIAIIFSACEPVLEDKIELPAAPAEASFDITGTADPNTFILTNTTPNTFLYQWDVESAGTMTGAEVEAFFPQAGDFLVTLTAFNEGGSASISKFVTVEANVDSPCENNKMLLTGCEQKTWKLEPAEGALFVGSNAGETWWSSAEEVVEERACAFNDEFIFTVDDEFIFDNKGDLWADESGGTLSIPGLDVGCQDSALLPESHQAWGSGTHTFFIDDATLTVSGTGAWIGLYKVGGGAEVFTPQGAVTYDIVELTDTRMVLTAPIPDGFWRFTLVAN